MLELWTGLCAAVLLAAAWQRYGMRKKPLPCGLLLCDGEDADIKIAEGPISTGPSQEELAEQAARQFLEQKDAGNIEKARELGRRYARELMEREAETPELHRKGTTQQEIHHQLLLCSYAVNHAIAEHSPNSIVAQTSLNVFYSELEEHSPALHQHVSDMAAFSLYVLCERSRHRSVSDIGQIYAKLVGQEGKAKYIRQGDRLFREFYGLCAKLAEQAGYVEV